MKKILIISGMVVAIALVPFLSVHKANNSAVPCLRADGIVLSCESTKIPFYNTSYNPKMQYNDVVNAPVIPEPTPQPETDIPKGADATAVAPDTATTTPEVKKTFNPITDTNPDAQLGVQSNGLLVTN